MDVNFTPQQKLDVLHTARSLFLPEYTHEIAVLDTIISDLAIGITYATNPHAEMPEVSYKVTRDATTGEFVAKEEAKRRPNETVVERVKRVRQPRKG
jgi:hypothetical protein